MGRPPGTLHLLLCLTLLPSISVATSAQNVAPSEYKLQVISAKYLADKDVIQYKLVNTGNNPVTAFSAEISAEVGGRDAIRNGGPVDWRRDLLYGELFLQCQNAPENADEEDVNPFANPIQLKGTIKPGQTYIQDLPGSLYLDKDSLQLGFPTIHAQTGDVEDAGRNSSAGDRGPQVGLQDNQTQEYEHGRGRGHQRVAHIVHRFRTVLEKISKEEDQHGLRQFRWLKREASSVNPAVSIVRAIKKENGNQQQGGDAHQGEDQRRMLVTAIVQSHRHNHAL